MGTVSEKLGSLAFLLLLSHYLPDQHFRNTAGLAVYELMLSSFAVILLVINLQWSIMLLSYLLRARNPSFSIFQQKQGRKNSCF